MLLWMMGLGVAMAGKAVPCPEVGDSVRYTGVRRSAGTEVSWTYRVDVLEADERRLRLRYAVESTDAPDPLGTMDEAALARWRTPPPAVEVDVDLGNRSSKVLDVQPMVDHMQAMVDDLFGGGALWRATIANPEVLRAGVLTDVQPLVGLACGPAEPGDATSRTLVVPGMGPGQHVTASGARHIARDGRTVEVNERIELGAAQLFGPAEEMTRAMAGQFADVAVAELKKRFEASEPAVQFTLDVKQSSKAAWPRAWATSHAVTAAGQSTHTDIEVTRVGE